MNGTLTSAALKQRPFFAILIAVSGSHLLNDMMQSLIIALYPLLSATFKLSFSQVGLITLTYQMTASLLQPLIGYVTDRKPHPYSLPCGMCCTLVGLLCLAFAQQFWLILLAAALIGMGSAIFHPESSRIARMAAGGRYGMAQSLFQMGGNLGASFGPLLAALLITPYGQQNITWVGLAALLAIVILLQVSQWYKQQLTQTHVTQTTTPATQPKLSKQRALFIIGILLFLVFSKMFYLSSINSYYIFYLKDKFTLSDSIAQLYLFLFLLAVAIGTMIGGPLGDKIGRNYVIWFSILGAAPFTLLLPYVSLSWTAILSFCIGIIISSAFPAIIVYAQEIIAGKVGTISGLFFGFSFGMGGLGAATLGKIADLTSIHLVYQICAFLPLLGLLAIFLPRRDKLHLNHRFAK